MQQSEREHTPNELVHRDTSDQPAESVSAESEARQQPLPPRPQPATTGSSPLRGSEAFMMATTDRIGGTSAGSRMFDHLATQAIHKALRSYHRGLLLTPLAMRMVKKALRRGLSLTGTTLRKLVEILRTVIPTTLATIRNALNAEKTPEGRDHAPIPGAFPSVAEGHNAAAESSRTDHVDPEPEPRPASPKAASMESHHETSKLPAMATTAFTGSSPGARTPPSAGWSTHTRGPFGRFRPLRMRFLRWTRRGAFRTLG